MIIACIITGMVYYDLFGTQIHDFGPNFWTGDVCHTCVVLTGQPV